MILKKDGTIGIGTVKIESPSAMFTSGPRSAMIRFIHAGETIAQAIIENGRADVVVLGRSVKLFITEVMAWANHPQA